MSDTELQFIEDIGGDTSLIQEVIAIPQPKVKNAPNKSPVGSPKSSVFSLTLDQVNDNADELIELRGEGRYFGTADTITGPICSNCHRRGHIRNKCKVVVCHSCGVIGDHYETQCPKSKVCSNCGQNGHFRGQCTEKNKRTYCRNCDSFQHTDDRCPSIWRSYLMLPAEKKSRNSRLPDGIYCYNCGEQGHFGDECPVQRSSRTPNFNGSAFSGNNLPKEYRDLYFSSMERKKKRPRDDSYGNYDYGRDFYHEEPRNKKPKFKPIEKKRQDLPPPRKSGNILPPRPQSYGNGIDFPRGAQSKGYNNNVVPSRTGQVYPRPSLVPSSVGYIPSKPSNNKSFDGSRKRFNNPKNKKMFSR